MTEPEGVEEDLFADLYDADEPTAQNITSAAPAPVPEPSTQPAIVTNAAQPENVANSSSNIQTFNAYSADAASYEPHMNLGEQNGISQFGVAMQDGDASTTIVQPETQGTGIKEDGKMFIGGLNWETTDQSLKDYFSQFGEVQECTVMRDGATGRSRGFGFLTFKDPKTVNTVMVKEHYLDGKIIDPKRAIPRDEQERTSKIFVGGVSQEATEQDFKQFFMQFGRVVDATLMIDKDTGRPRGFGFVTFDSEAAVDGCLSQPLEILGKSIEVKKAQPRGNLRDEEDRRARGRGFDRFKDEKPGGTDGAQPASQGQANLANTMTPQMMAQYWQRMQQYFAMMQQQMALATQNQGMPAAGAMGGMNPAMIQQMQQLKQMQQMNAMTGGQPAGNMSPSNQAAMPQGMMNPMIMQQMQQAQQAQQAQQMQQLQQMQQMQNQQSQSASGYGGPVMGGQMGAGKPGNMNQGMTGGPNGMGGGNFGGIRTGPGYNAQEQLAFEQQKYEQQQARRAADPRNFGGFQQGTPGNWDNGFEEQVNIPTGPQASMSRGGSVSRGGMSPSPSVANKAVQKIPTPQPQSAPPANAPTGPRNAGKPGANYRGGARGGHRGFHPYARG
ncbi:hypothetical protein LOZ53_001523 [Ophidiomyces ophidiicola]|uniref:Uncharacterized protein n=1 Tax=Ophidiomyces ophidiicola TaxID=1387563 RepID=A0ACB8V2F9_9EURO|nr:hypothetical protein LOZ61_001193 [Ophidiomyces ophidiicola]KAI1921042.1 hypothetical protein LOZ64_001668 [Ophidiomyces ophidiicola]KAI1929441.1 hypothetical protein LOZ60_001654 [Ophidiomyces ophidiicola]KAI1954506.1 hypothetical protein LOZ62_000800 [Ophidiomyces ophidiicola]KAI1961806.1 hypothetical protein LOZ59_002245 [Ophidiomyces ophidiicola]